MARLVQNVTKGELGVLNALWDKGPTTIREVTDAVYADGTIAQYATVQKLLERLEEKGYVRRDRSNRAHVFQAIIGRDELIGWEIQELANGLSGGSIASLFAELVKPVQLTSMERASLQNLVAELERQRNTIERAEAAGDSD
ncbi:MAG: BlaI/MecI/CopY family transcriptional regulator [Planctomycetaceae bacterium]|jgi:predicted transcriptional regulator|nr:BlaI/MecI/CopY family transcriptional regulator [Planctomycetaceae bacterium]